MSSNNNITDNRVTLNGVNVYPFRSFDELLAIAEKHKGILVSINAEKILHATDETRGIINRNIGFCDGVGAVYAMRQKGHPEACKLPGCELWLKTIAARYRDKTFYLVGGRQEVIDETVAKLRKEYPGIRIVGFRNGYLKTPEESAALIPLPPHPPAQPYQTTDPPATLCLLAGFPQIIEHHGRQKLSHLSQPDGLCPLRTAHS